MFPFQASFFFLFARENEFPRSRVVPGRSRARPSTWYGIITGFIAFLSTKKKIESQSASGGERGRGKLQKLAIIDNRSLLFPIQHNPELTLRTSEAMINSRIFSHQTFAPFYMLSLGIKFLLHQRTL